MERKDLFKKISNYAFIAGLICEIFVMPSGYTLLYLGYKYVTLLGMVCFALSLLLSMDLKRDIKIFIPVFGFGLVCYYFQGSALMLRLALIILAGRTQERDKVIKSFFFGTAAWIAVIFLLALLGVKGSVFTEGAFRHSADELRFTFGFMHPNGFAFFWIKLAVMGMYLYGGRMKPWIACTVYAAGLIPLIMAMTKAGIAAYMFFALICLYLNADKDKDRSRKLLYYGGGGTMIALMLFIFTLGIVPYPQEHVGEIHNAWDAANELTTGRLQKARDVLTQNTPALFGSKGIDAVNEIGFVDALYRQGIVFVAAYCVLLFVLLYRFNKENDTRAMFMLLCFTFYVIAESYLPLANKNAVWLLMLG